jgi:hypothetical protein
MARSLVLSLSLVSASIALLGCDPQVVTPDAGRDAAVGDTSGETDAPLVADASTDVPAVDAPTVCACDADQTCLRGVCIATCDGLDGIDAALAPGVVPVAHACRSAGAMDAVGSDVYELVALPGASETVLRLVRWTFADGAVTPTTIAETTYVLRGKPAEDVYPGYVAVSDDEAHALFGYTTSLSGFQGGVVDIDVGAMTPAVISADGNFDATFVDGSRYLVNGLGFAALDGQALYLADATESDPEGTTVIEAMGDASGSVAVWEELDYVVFGGARYGSTWPDGTMGGLLFVAPLDTVLDATAPIDAYQDTMRVTGAPGVFEMITGGRLLEVYYGASGIDGLRYTQLTTDGEGAVGTEAPVDVTTDGTFFQAAAIEDDVLLVHGTGTLRVTLP